MSQENIEVLRKAYELAESRGVEGLLDFATEDLVWISDPRFPGGGRTWAKRTSGGGCSSSGSTTRSRSISSRSSTSTTGHWESLASPVSPMTARERTGCGALRPAGGRGLLPRHQSDRGGWLTAHPGGGSIPRDRGGDATLGALADLRTGDGRSFRVTPIDQPAGVTMPDEFEPTKLARRTLTIVAVLAVVGLILLLAPGLGEVRHLLTEAQPEWVALAVAFEALSCVSYVLLFRPIFCHMMPWRTSWEIGLSELAAGSIVPASGAGGLALGASILRQGGMPAERIARRSVAFFILKSSVNFVAVAVLGTVMALGLVGPDLSPWLTAVPAVGALLVIAAVLLVPRLGVGAPPRPTQAARARRCGTRARRWWGARPRRCRSCARAICS